MFQVYRTEGNRSEQSIFNSLMILIFSDDQGSVLKELFADSVLNLLRDIMSVRSTGVNWARIASTINLLRLGISPSLFN